MSNDFLYNYGQFKSFTGNNKAERKTFLENKKNALNALYFFDCPLNLEIKKEEEINIMIKQKIEEQKNQLAIKVAMNAIIKPWGISFTNLDKEEKNELFKLDFSFERFTKYAKEYLLKYRQNCINLIPEMERCFDDEYFIYFCQLFGKPKITINNILNNIRDYFILDVCNEVFHRYRSDKEYQKIKKDITDFYPTIKNNYGINKYLDKFLSYFFNNNDYNHKETKVILDNYYNQNKNYIKLKDKDD